MELARVWRYKCEYEYPASHSFLIDSALYSLIQIEKKQRSSSYEAVSNSDIHYNKKAFGACVHLSEWFAGQNL